MYTLKSAVRRSSLLGAAVALVAATLLPTTAVFADSLNPLTERSLLLSSSAPGFQNTDGSGNSETSPNAGGTNYAPPGSGPNGMKTGETFSFRVSTDSVATTTPIKAFTLQYCTTAAGFCQAPGNNTGDSRDTTREDNATAFANPVPTSDLDVVTDGVTPWAEGTGPGTYQVLLNDTPTSGWVMSTKNVEDDAYVGDLTGKNNFITLTNTTGITPVFNDKIDIVFSASSTNYITNPGADAFFVKINTYDSDNTSGTDLLPDTDANIIDGGVTVANVMTDSIHITTKVLETMAFSVGTQNPDTQPVQHGSCDAINVINGNRLELGNLNAEYSLETDTAYDVYSYWRLSSNSSGGATVYYSGNTLANTVGDDINPMTTMAHSQPGTEQFGMALVDAGLDALDSATGPDTGDMDGDGDTAEILPLRPFPANHVTPNIAPLIIESDYANGAGTISDTTTANNAQFTFKSSSLQTPEVIAQENTDVISCATSKVRYVANIAADTPSGVYTTKINYLAAPQY